MFKKGSKIECIRCGGGHLAPDCHHKDAKCYKCGTVGHLASKCLKKKDRGKKLSTGHYLETTESAAAEAVTESDAPAEYSLYKFHASKHPPIIVPVQVNGKLVEMELDSGSPVTITSEAEYYRLREELAENMPELIPTDLRLKTWLKETCSAIGEMTVRVQYKDQDMVLPIVVGPGDGPTLLGRNWLQKLKLDWTGIFAEANIHAVQSAPGNLQQLLDKYKSVFSSDLAPSKV